jgi:methylenetetrahydrofolate dehydrogenase (NADP+)/methenyltetrahydrofolate cyclohydrolase
MLDSLVSRLNHALLRLASANDVPSSPLLRVLLPVHAHSRRASLASATYVAVKRRRLAALGIRLDVDRVSLLDPLALALWCRRASADPVVAAAFVQLPLIGSRFRRRQQADLDLLALHKDVDGLSAASCARLGTPAQLHAPATALGVAMLLEYAGVTSARQRGAHVVVVGKGRLCGAPLTQLLAAPSIGATVSLCDVYSRRTAVLCRAADAIVTAVGGGHVITAEHIDPAAETVVIDVGAGDVAPAAGSNARLFVPRVGELTVAALAANTLNAVRLRAKRRPIDFVSLVRNAHLLPDAAQLPLEAVLAAPQPPHDDDGQSEPWFPLAKNAVSASVDLTLASNADLHAALAVFALPRTERPDAVILHVRAAFSDVEAVERLCCAMARAVDIVCIAVQSDGAALSPLALAADFCLTTLARVDVDALLQAPSALAVARARIGDVVLVRDVAFGDLVRDGSDVYLPSLLANLRQAHSRARASALQRKLELRMALLHREEEPSAANDE